ncbi:nuclear transport factor 2 family protein [Sphingobacterium sp. HJSM2_6]|uniref:nuclear transport factor 2 family protein n=1 Tax=Sphingobacterium sp. HJSM2_6 TaxID=3366264 RepID=UPI003BD5BB7A
MKSLIKSIALVSLFTIASISVFAKKPKATLNSAVIEQVVDAYINTTVKGNTEFVNQLFDNNFVQRFQTDHKQAAVTKAAYIKHLKSQEGIAFDCDTQFDIIEKSEHYSIAKVSLSFDTFTRIDYVSLQWEDQAWKIKEVNSVFKNN